MSGIEERAIAVEGGIPRSGLRGEGEDGEFTRRCVESERGARRSNRGEAVAGVGWRDEEIKGILRINALKVLWK